MDIQARLCGHCKRTLLQADQLLATGPSRKRDGTDLLSIDSTHSMMLTDMALPIMALNWGSVTESGIRTRSDRMCCNASISLVVMYRPYVLIQ